MTQITLAKNAVAAKLVGAPSNIETFVSSLLSYQVEDRSIGNWSGNSTFFNTVNKTFPAGFTSVVYDELAKLGHRPNLVQKPIVSPLGEDSPIVDEFGNDNPKYDFQMKALRQVEKHGAGIIRVATGGGKSKIAKLIMKRFRRMTLFLTTRGILMYQMKDQLDDINVNTGIIGDGQMKAVRGVNLGMVQTMVQALKEPLLDEEVRSVIESKYSKGKGKKAEISDEVIYEEAQAKFDKKVRRRNAIIKFLSLIEVVIGEEAHEAGGESYYEILKHCKNASIRVALTATPFMRASAEDNMRLMAAFGPILIDISEQELINRGILARPYFKYVDVPAPPTLRRSSGYEKSLKVGMTENPYMHEAIIRDCRMAASYKLPGLLLVGRKNHGANLNRILNDAGIDSHFLKGEDDMTNRRLQLERLVAGELNVVIGTTILDVGVDVPAIGFLGLCGGGKAEIALRQRIGRVLRSKKSPLPNISFVADYSCNVSKYLAEHQQQRRWIVERTPGFCEGVLAPEQDFDWKQFSH